MSVIRSDYPLSTKLSDYVYLGKDCTIGEDVVINSFSNLYGCTLKDNVMIGTFCELQTGSVVGERTRIQSHTFICSGVEIGDDCFISHSVVFINDTFSNGKVNFDKTQWKKTIVGNNVKIGSNATIMPVHIGENATIGAGAVVLYDVEPNTTVVGNPAKPIKHKL